LEGVEARVFASGKRPVVRLEMLVPDAYAADTPDACKYPNIAPVIWIECEGLVASPWCRPHSVITGLTCGHCWFCRLVSAALLQLTALTVAEASGKRGGAMLYELAMFVRASVDTAVTMALQPGCACARALYDDASGRATTTVTTGAAGLGDTTVAGGAGGPAEELAVTGAGTAPDRDKRRGRAMGSESRKAPSAAVAAALDRVRGFRASLSERYGGRC
jgi:hypothetical protein